MMKLRASWGKTGNNQIGSYSSKALIAPYEYVYGSEFAPGFSTQTAPNNNLSWETNSSYNFGMDINFFNKVNLSANYYKSTTSDLLLKVPVPQQSGYSTSLQNIGEVRNSGIEIELSSYNINLGPVKWNFNANLTTNENEVLSLAPEQKQIITGRYGAFRTKVGGPIAELYGYNVIGVYKTQGEINETPHLRGTMTGDYIVEDVNQDNVIDDKDKVGFGTNAPDFTYGISSSFSYNDFELSFALTGVEGRTVYDADIAAITEVGEGFGMPSKHYFENRYHPVNNPKGYFAQPNMGNFSSARRNTRASSMAFSNADYIRMRQLTFAYHFPKTFLQSSGISKARIYFTANNLFTITDYRGFNLESTSSNPLEAGYSNWGGYPVPKSYIIGINLSF